MDAPRKGRPASRSGGGGLDWFTFFIANLQTGFGPFVSVYLTSIRWTQVDIGFVLTLGGLVGLFGQAPGGALVDRVRFKRGLAATSVVLVAVSALLLGIGESFPIILFAWILHAVASCTLQPAIGVMSLALVGHGGIARRLGRNAAFASVGSALAAAGMGAVGSYVSNRAVFFVTAALLVPALIALYRMPAGEVNRPPFAAEDDGPEQRRLRDLLRNRTLVIFTICIVLFYLASATLLPLLGSLMTRRSDTSPAMLIAACIIIPQIMVALLSPLVGTLAERWGRRPLLLIGFAALPLRAFGFSLVSNHYLLVAVQILDGVSAAVLGVIVPLVVADATRRSGGFALAQGLVATGLGLGAALSTTLGGYMADVWGSRPAFLALAMIGAGAFIACLVFMPETRPQPRRDDSPIRGH